LNQQNLENNTEELFTLLQMQTRRTYLINLQMMILKAFLHICYNGFTNYALKDPENIRVERFLHQSNLLAGNELSLDDIEHVLKIKC
jgi:hypothetical protein